MGLNGFHISTQHVYDADLKTYALSSSHGQIIAVGDAVALTGTANADGINEVGHPAAGNTDKWVGVVTAIDLETAIDNGNKTYLPALTAGLVKVETSPDAVWIARANAAGLALTDAYNNALLDVTSPVGGRSAMGFGAASAAAAVNQVRLIGPVDSSDLGDNSEWYVQVNPDLSQVTQGVI